MENQSNSVESLVDRVRSYADTRINLVKLKAIDKSSAIIAMIISLVALILVIFIFIILLNIGIALLIGKWLGNSYYGFFIVAGFYAIAGIILMVFRNKWLKAPITNMMIKSLLE